MRGEDVSNIDVNPIPSPRRLTHQAEQLRLRRPQRIVATAVDSVLLCTEQQQLHLSADLCQQE